MNRAYQITQSIQSLLEARTISKRLRNLSNETFAFRRQSSNHVSRIVNSWLKTNKIKTTDDLISYIEKEFKKHPSANVLLNHVDWMVAIFVYHDIEWLTSEENFSLLENMLLKADRFIRLKLLPKTVLSTWPSPTQLGEILSDIQDPADEQSFYDNADATLLYEDSKIKVVRVYNERAVKFFASGSRGRSNPWCIWRKSQYDIYHSDGYRWIILLVKNSAQKYAIDTTYGLVWNATNRQIDLENVVSNFPILKKIAPSLTATPREMIPFIRTIVLEFQEAFKPLLRLEPKTKDVEDFVEARYEKPIHGGFSFLVTVQRRYWAEKYFTTEQIYEVAEKAARSLNVDIGNIVYPSNYPIAHVYLFVNNPRW